MNKDRRKIRQSITFLLGSLITLWFIWSEPVNVLESYYSTVCLGGFVLIEVLCFVIEQLFVYSIKSKTNKENLRFRKWQNKVDKFWLEDCFLSIGRKPLITHKNYQKCCELIDKLCKDKLVSIDNKKVLYEALCLMWTNYGMDEGIYTIPFFIQEKWKKAQVDDKLKQLKKDF